MWGLAGRCKASERRISFTNYTILQYQTHHTNDTICSEIDCGDNKTWLLISANSCYVNCKLLSFRVCDMTLMIRAYRKLLTQSEESDNEPVMRKIVHSMR